MKRAICLMTLILAALLAGCGGSSDSTQTQIATPTITTPTSISKAQFIKEGDGVCAEVNAALGSLTSTSTSSANAAGQRASLYQGMMERLRGLGRPGDQTGLDQVLTAGDNIVSAEQKAEQATTNNDNAALASAESEAASAESSFSSAASAYGFKECGGGPTTPSTTATAPSTAAPVTPAAPTTAAPAPVAPAQSGGAGIGTGTGTGGGTGGATGGGSTGGTSGGSGGVAPG
jgi:hypothetical protein